MRTMFTTFAVTSVLIAAPLGGCDIDKTQEGALPEVEVSEGQLPEYEVETPTVNVGTSEETVEVPDVDVHTQTEEITVPTVDVDVPEEEDPAE